MRKHLKTIFMTMEKEEKKKYRFRRDDDISDNI